MGIVKHISVLLFFLLTIPSCKKKKQEEQGENKYEWSAQISAPDHYPATYVNVGLNPKNENDIGAGASSVFTAISPGWGDPYGSFASGRRPKALPAKVTAQWMSVPEAVFYRGEFDLDTKRIEELFAQEYYEPVFDEYVKLNRIMVGVAPGGIVTVWANGPGQQFEVGRFQAQKINYTPDRLEISGLTMQNWANGLLKGEDEDFIKRYGIPYEVWKTPPPEHKWHIDVVHPKHYPIRCKGAWSNNIDGSKSALMSKNDIYDNWGQPIGKEKEYPKSNPAPLTINVTWFSGAEKKFYTLSDSLDYKKIDSLFTLRYPHPKKLNTKARFNSLKVGLAPGGIVVIWVDGAGREIEIARYQAKVLELSIQEYTKKMYGDEMTDKDFINQIIKEKDRIYIEKNGILFGSW